MSGIRFYSCYRFDIEIQFYMQASGLCSILCMVCTANPYFCSYSNCFRDKITSVRPAAQKKISDNFQKSQNWLEIVCNGRKSAILVNVGNAMNVFLFTKHLQFVSRQSKNQSRNEIWLTFKCIENIFSRRHKVQFLQTRLKMNEC